MEPERTLASPLVIVGTGATVVIAGSQAPSLRRDVQAALDGSEPVVGFLSALTANGVRDLPHFAYVGREGSAVRVLLRGEVVAVARDEGGAKTELAAGSVSTWTEVVRTDCVDVELQVGGEPIAVVSYGVPAIGASESQTETVIEPDQTAAPGSGAVSVDETIFPGPDLAREHVALDEPQQPLEVPVPLPSPTSSSDDEVDLSHLFETRHVGVEAAAIRAADPEHDAPPAGDRVDLPPPVGPSPGGLSDLPPPAGAPVAAPPPPGLIAGVPGMASSSASAPEAPGDHDGLTISPAQLAALRGGAEANGSARPSTQGGPQLQAVGCPSGHLNPPQADRCRACGQGIADRSIRVVNRPSLGHLSFDGGTVVDIDRPLLIGRKPTVEGLAGAAEVPGLVVLPDPEGSLSRVHAEVRIEGWEVLVVDRNSTNGTFVEVPGQPPVMLRPMEACLISPGTRITFADVASCAFQTGPR